MTNSPDRASTSVAGAAARGATSDRLRGGRGGSSGRGEVRRLSELRLRPELERVSDLRPTFYAGFRDDIAARGLRVPIKIRTEGHVLGGSERLRAGRELGLREMPVRVVGPDELDDILRAALLRRQLTLQQQTTIALELSDCQQLQRRDGATSPPPTTPQPPTAACGEPHVGVSGAPKTGSV